MMTMTSNVIDAPRSHWIKSISDTIVTLAGTVNDAKWHKVSWEQRGGTLVIESNNIEYNIAGSLQVTSGINKIIVIYIGARPFIPG